MQQTFRRKHLKYLILGAGPSGLTIAHSLLDAGIRPEELIVLEKECSPGGLCRSEIVDGAPLDIGGGHFLDDRNKDVLNFLFRFMQRDEWMSHKRKATIRIDGKEVDHPLEANIWQFNRDEQLDYLESVARSGSMRGDPMPDKFADWVSWKLGSKIAESYMLPYNRKIWSMSLDLLGTYWLQKLPQVSFRETLQSCLDRRPFGTLPAHGTFLYPRKYGYGEVWKRMGRALGDRLRTGTSVARIDLDNRVVNDEWQAEVIFSTIPWPVWTTAADLPLAIRGLIEKLIHVSIDIDYCRTSPGSGAYWTYEPDESVSYHRILLRANFCADSVGSWTETNARRSGEPVGFRHHNEFAYPVNTVEKIEVIRSLHTWARSSGIVPAGRWGNWEHMNSDVAVAEGIKLGRTYGASGADR